MQITFLGATNTVTGSKFLVQARGATVLIDCGLFQGYKQLRQRNWQRLPFPPSKIDAVILTHAHIDHSGWLPVLVKQGFRGPIYATKSTCDLVEILLADSGRIQEEEAEYANRKGYSKHHPAEPLYTEAEGIAAAKHCRAVEFGTRMTLAKDVDFAFAPAGHILGAGFVSIREGTTDILFTGDIGRPGMPIIDAPSIVTAADYLVCESTYGNRRHPDEDPVEEIAKVVVPTLERGGIVLIPSFAVARAQMICAYLLQLHKAGRLPNVPVYLNSPMALDVSRLYVEHHDEHRLSLEQCNELFSWVKYIRSIDESKALNADRSPKIVISSSGMATAGRVLHHMKTWGPDPKNTILFVGFQAGGTRGADLLGGERRIRIHGDQVVIRAQIANINCLSAHGDYEEILDWMGHFKAPPRCTYLVHGEPAALEGLRRHITGRLSWPVEIPDYGETVVLQDDPVPHLTLPTA